MKVRFWKFCEQINAIYENEHGLLQKALPEDNLEFTSQRGRHSLTSYAVVPTLENESRKKQEESDLLEFDEKPTSTWSYKSLLGFKDTNDDVQSSMVTPTSGNKIEENKILQNLGTKSMLLPHLKVGVHVNNISSSSLKIEDKDKILNGQRNKNISSKLSNKETISNSTPKETS